MNAVSESVLPGEAELKKAMKKMSLKERRVLLKEIERARQAKIHMSFILEQQ